MEIDWAREHGRTTAQRTLTRSDCEWIVCGFAGPATALLSGDRNTKYAPNQREQKRENTVGGWGEKLAPEIQSPSPLYYEAI